MKNKKYIITLIILIGLMFSALVGASYSYIRKTVIQEEDTNLNTLTCFDLTIEASKDENGEAVGAITIENAYAISDAKGLETTPYTFKVTNNCDSNAEVSLNLESLQVDNGLDISYVKYNLTNRGASPKVGTLLSSRTTTTSSIEGSTSKVLTTFILEAKESVEFDLRLWVAEETTAEQGMGKSFKAKVVAMASPTPLSGNPESWYTAESGTLLGALRDGVSSGAYEYVFAKTSDYSIPGQEISTSSEAYLTSAEDDYGISYYFRGAVENNYVVFANMCWRIVRITGDGSIKLTLYNYNSDKENVTNPCNVTGTSLAFARYSGTTYLSAFNSGTSSNAYVGFMYGTANSSSYSVEHENLYDSTILTNLKTWYDANFDETQQSLLADTIWCNDKRLYSGVGYSDAKSYYAANGRLSTVATASPSLKCGENKNDNKISKFTASDTIYGNGKLRGVNGVGDTEYKIGLLTADEVAFAGEILGTANYTYYLYKNASSNSWWFLSPWYCYRGTDGARVGHMYYTYFASYLVAHSSSVRPAISLVSTAKISGGDGTSTNPYVIDES
jgi:hypothetical protein